jgi:hypothetical protein
MKSDSKPLLSHAANLLHVAEDEGAFRYQEVLAVLAVDGVGHHDLQRSGKLPVQPVYEHGVDGGAFKNHIGLAVRGVHVYLRRPLVRGCSSSGLRRSGRQQARRASRCAFAQIGRLGRGVRSSVLGGDEVRREAGLEGQRFLRVRHWIAGWRGWRRRQCHRSRRAVGLHGGRRTARRGITRQVLLRHRLLALALVGAQVLFQLMDLPQVGIDGDGQRSGVGGLRGGFGVVFGEHHRDQDQHGKCGHHITLGLLGHHAFGQYAFVP